MPRWLPVLVALLAAALVAGCGGDDDGDNGGAAGDLQTVEAGVLTVGSDIPFPPFEYLEGGEEAGFDVELVNEMASRLGLETKWVDTPFDTLFTQLAGGRFDVVASATTITEERQQTVNFTESYYAAQQALIVNSEETPDIASTDDLGSGDVVAVQSGTTGEIWARENVPEGVDVRSFPDAPDTYTALEAGNVTAVIFDEPSALAEAGQRPSLSVVDTIDTGERYGFAVDPNNEELLDALNDALQEMLDDGTYERIYGDFDLPPGGSILEAD
ncbi:MAG TPA: basic amino acid ABC transporter substrate-binding protein [Gaiellaceae bacterium]|nr:basic amino acid ABC transporter substrate-binding protein [Gaiellaceae bacterium]